ncbi:MAG: CBS domain-containing protein [Polyangiales bacterium]
MLTAREICRRTVVQALRTDTLRSVARRMRDEHTGCVVIVEDGRAARRVKPIGIVTDRDIVLRAVAGESLDALQPIEAVMSRELIAAREEDKLGVVLELMRTHGFRRLPVVDADGHLVGIVTFDDVLDFLQEQVSDVGVLLAHARRREVRALRSERP